jgi:hypothetical protein
MTRKALLPLFLLCLSAPLFAVTASRPLTSFPKADLKEPVNPGDILFVVAGDNRPTAKGAPLPRVLDTIFSEIGLIRPAFVLWTGDTVYGYCDTEEELKAEYQAFADKAKPIAGLVPLFNAPGNHEIHSDQSGCKTTGTLCWADPGTSPPRCSEKVFRDHFGELYGSFNYAGMHFVALDTEVPGHEDEISGRQLAWLRGDLKASKSASATFVFTHTEFFPSPLIDPPAGRSHPSIANGPELEDLFVHSSVQGVFSGHEHLFWHEPAGRDQTFIDYFVAGGAGAPLYASPDRGGFSHYLVVHMSGGKISYELIEPGHLYIDETPESMPAEFCNGARCAWIVNSNDVHQALPLNGIDLTVPASLGDCSHLTVQSRSRGRDSWGDPQDVATDCTASPPGKIHVKGLTAPQGSTLLTVSRKSTP